MEIDKRYPVFGFWFRRYAPFKEFGRINPYQPLGVGYFEGDNRGSSTSLKVTSRTYGAVFFNHLGIVYSFAGSSGSHYHDRILDDVVTAFDKTKMTLTKILPGPELFSFKTSTSGSNPLMKPGFATPNIDTFANVTVDFTSSGKLKITGESFGDNFPNLEVFLYCYRSSRAALLLDGRTKGWAHTGPMKRLWGKSESLSLGKFVGVLSLDEKGELSANSTVGSTEI